MVIILGAVDKSEKRVQASTFKAQCLAILDGVAQSRRSVVVTKHGKPVAKVVPVDDPAPTLGSVVLVSDDDDDYFSTGTTWDAAR